MDVDPIELAKAVGHDIEDFTIEAIDPQLRLHSVTGGVYRVKGESFSLVIKIVQHGRDPSPDALWVSGAEETHRNYWKREWEAYCSGFLDALPGELRAPRTLRCTENGPDECWIWMEDVEGIPGSEWALDDYDSVAFDLATTQAAYAAGRSVAPTAPWLARNWLRDWVDQLGTQIGALDDDALWQSESQAPMAALRDRVRNVWAQREALLSIVETAPQTVVHGDLWPANLIAADDGTTVAVDWSQVGLGAVGQDLDQLTLDPVWMQVKPHADLAELEAHVLPAYLSGLRSSGFQVDEDSLRRWYAAAAGIHYAPLAASQAVNAADQGIVAAREQRHGLPYAVIVANQARVVARACDLADEALSGR
jgi:aminoglycoside phosphotransferase (APT) family kinase protein